MNSCLEWTGEQERDGVSERSFRIGRTAGSVPGVLWRPAFPGPPAPLVLLGHGGSGHKRNDKMTGHARSFAAAGIAALAIDLPYHGERVEPGDPLTASQYQARIAAEGIETVLDRTTGDWLAALGAVGPLGLVDTGCLGFLGLSMGARFGLPLAAALGSRLRCAVLGKYGLRQGPGLDPGLAAQERTASDARLLTAPVLLHVQLDDELFPREGQLALFDLLGSADKRLIAYPGPHTRTPPEAVALWRDFVVSRLRPARG